MNATLTVDNYTSPTVRPVMHSASPEPKRSKLAGSSLMKVAPYAITAPAYIEGASGYFEPPVAQK